VGFARFFLCPVAGADRLNPLFILTGVDNY
jgi:hypothetical protein